MARKRQPARAPTQPPAPPVPAPLDEGVLRRFVFQTFARARRTQDSPVVPDVWLRYIRVAEDIAHARIAGKPLPDGGVDLLLTRGPERGQAISPSSCEIGWQ
jgi:hypothetical protein